jgi:dipicolinate synthase subunit A
VNAKNVFGGRIPETVKDTLRLKGTRVYDLLEDEALLIKNAQLTAEGALGIIINETSRAVLGARILIFGYGRVGRALAQVLTRLGADVLAVARKPEQLACAECDGCTPIPFSEAYAYTDSAHVICNTAPVCVIDGNFSADALFIELASGGYNAERAKEAGIRFINAQGLPGKTAPETAAEIIYDRITDNLLRQI